LGCSLTIHRICHIHSAREGWFVALGNTRTETEADDLLVPSEFAEREARRAEKPSGANSWSTGACVSPLLTWSRDFLDSAAFPSPRVPSSFVLTSYPWLHPWNLLYSYKLR